MVVGFSVTVEQTDEQGFVVHEAAADVGVREHAVTHGVVVQLQDFVHIDLG